MAITKEQATAAKMKLVKFNKDHKIEKAAVNAVRVGDEWEVTIRLQEKLPMGVSLPKEISGVSVSAIFVGTMKAKKN